MYKGTNTSTFLLLKTTLIFVVMGAIFSTSGVVKTEWAIEQNSDEPLAIQKKTADDYVKYVSLIFRHLNK